MPSTLIIPCIFRILNGGLSVRTDQTESGVEITAVDEESVLDVPFGLLTLIRKLEGHQVHVISRRGFVVGGVPDEGGQPEGPCNTVFLWRFRAHLHQSVHCVFHLNRW
jgi:hypothetical protein